MAYSNQNRAWDRMHKTKYLEDVGPPRCAKCHEVVSQAKRDCACTRALQASTKTPTGGAQ